MQTPTQAQKRALLRLQRKAQRGFAQIERRKTQKREEISRDFCRVKTGSLDIENRAILVIPSELWQPKTGSVCRRDCGLALKKKRGTAAWTELTHGRISKSSAQLPEELMVDFSPRTIRQRGGEIVEAGWLD